MDLNKIETEFVKKCKLLALNPEYHLELIKNEHFLELLVISLASTELNIVRTAMETLHLLLKNRSNHSVISSTYGILEAVNLASERLMDSRMSHLAKDIITVLTGPAYGTRSRKKKQLMLEEQEKSHNLVTKQIILHIIGLTSDNQTEIQKLLIQKRGIVSIHINLDEQLCTLRVLKNISPRDIGKLIHTKFKLETELVVRSDLQDKLFLSLNDEEDLPPYLPEHDSPVHNKAVSMLGQFKTNASGVFQWFQKSFYW
ncbi:hypothetical protein L9F63_007553 [Diploptera punctata]|uniref:Armadillo repeat-containing protein 1 n=1 Tax=Diploptera punctata TaxID=6984 RepID=A0AAD7Z7Y9_DIPPU|nr:hypothetical protein L9F63_007553 [Diploptera punctata]